MINQSRGIDGLSKEFYECFGDEVKKTFLASIINAFLNQKSSSSQKQAVINPLNAIVALVETSQLISTANQLTGFYMRATLAFSGLNCQKKERQENH